MSPSARYPQVWLKNDKARHGKESKVVIFRISICYKNKPVKSSVLIAWVDSKHLYFRKPLNKLCYAIKWSFKKQQRTQKSCVLKHECVPSIIHPPLTSKALRWPVKMFPSKSTFPLSSSHSCSKSLSANTVSSYGPSPDPYFLNLIRISLNI